jgi:hypothetical protein
MTTPKEIAESAEIALRVVDKLLGYGKELQWLFAKAVNMPRRAFLDLEAILAEIGKSLTAIDGATKVFFDAIQNPDGFIDNDGLLQEMSSAKLPALVEQKRTHCHDIGNIYVRYLSGSLSKLFRDAKEADKTRHILEQLSNADRDFFQELTRAAEKMRDLAGKAHKFKLGGQRQQAIALVRGAAPELLDMRDKFNDAYIEMRKIAGDFVKAARVAPA